MKTPQVPASSLIKTIAANVENEKLSDEEFREFVRNSLTACQELHPDKDDKQFDSEWIPERQSGFWGRRHSKTGEWIYEEDYKGRCDCGG